MSTTEALDELFDSVGRCFTPDVAARLSDLRVSDQLQAKLDTWADENSQGNLSDDELKQYESVLRVLNFVAVLQAKARLRISESSDP